MFVKSEKYIMKENFMSLKVLPLTVACFALVGFETLPSKSFNKANTFLAFYKKKKKKSASPRPLLQKPRSMAQLRKA